MKIKKLTYKDYGKFQDKQVDLFPELTLIYGENEAGKSTIFSSIKTVLYGFNPANREKHPLVNWETGNMALTGEIATKEGTFLIERQLKSVPKMTRIDIAKNQSEIRRNEAIRETLPISEALYDSVFHLTAEDLMQLEESSWEKIQQQFIFNFGMDYLNKPKEVIEQIEKEINELWRPDRRGNPKINRLESEIKKLQKERIDLEKDYEKLLQIIENVDKLNLEIAYLEKKVDKTSKEKNKVEMQLPIKEKHLRIETWLKQVEKPEIQEKLSTHFLVTYESCLKNREALLVEIKTLSAEIEMQISQLYTFTDEQEILLNSLEERRQLKQIAIELEEKTKLKNELMSTEKRMTRDIQILGKMVFKNEKFSEDDYERLFRINTVEVSSKLNAYLEGREKTGHFYAGSKKQILLLATVGIIFMGMSLVYRPFLWVGIFMIGYTIALIKMSINGEKRRLDALRIEINSDFKPFVVPEYVWTDKSQLFIVKFEQLAQKWHEKMGVNQELEETLKYIEELLGKATQLLDALGVNKTQDEALRYPMFLSQLESLERKREANRNKEGEIQILKRQMTALREKHQLEASKIQDMEEPLSSLGGGDIELGIRICEENQAILEKINAFRDELLGTDFPLDISREYLDALKNELATDLEMIQEKRLEKEGLEKDLFYLQKQMQMESIESELLALREDIEALKSERNIKMITCELLKYADEVYRKENQPDLLKYVSKYMAIMTNGKYTGVFITDEFNIQFLMNDEIIPLTESFSKGTINQLFLAFRLAVIEMLTGEGESLPIVFDETFVNWDKNRLEATLLLLEEISKRHQIILLTCHTRLLEKMPDKVVKLG